MKKLIAALLALAMLLALGGCSAAPDSQTPTEAPQTIDAAESTHSAETEVPAQDAEVTLGVIDGGVYTNTYAGFAVTLNESWQYYTAEQLQDLSNLTDELLQDSALAEQTGEFSQITDMMAECYDDLTSINILYTRLSTKERLAYALMSEEALIDLTLEQTDLLIQTYTDAGIDVTSMEKDRVSFLGEEHFAIRTVASIQGTPYHILQLFRYNLGGQYYITLTLASLVEDNTDSLLELFSAI